MAFLKTEAIVIKAINLREADKIMTFFSKDYGKIQGIARGIRKITSKYTGKLELFNRVQVIFFQKRTPLQSSGFPEQHPLLSITQVDVVKVFPQFQSDFNKIIGASYIAEFLTTLFEDYDATHPAVYGLVCETLATIAASEQIRNILPAFEMKLLAHLGYTPVLNRCMVCGVRIQGAGLEGQDSSGALSSAAANHAPVLGFSSATGGVLCQRCQMIKQEAISLTRQSVALLQQLFTTPMPKTPLIALSTEQYREIKTLLMHHYRYHLGLDLKTEKFVQKLRAAHLTL